MANEIKRVMAKHGSSGEDSAQRVIDLSAIELGISPRTLRDWLGPVSAKGWEELQVSPREAMDKLLTTPSPKKKSKKKKGKSCKTTRATALRA